MSSWQNWSGSFEAPVTRIERPRSLPELIEIVRGVSNVEGRIHAEGSRWAFSSPAYCDDVMVSTDYLNGFPISLQEAIMDPLPAGTRSFRVAVEAGIKVRHLYTALAGSPPVSAPPPGGTPPPVLPPGDWTLPTLGGAGGQSIAGAINTGTHGGDVARPPISDGVLAMLIVGGGGQLRLIQRPQSKGAAPVVDAARLAGNLRSKWGRDIPVEEILDGDLLDAAVVSVGRFGIVYAYVLNVVDESGSIIMEQRLRSSWNEIQGTLYSEVMEAAARDEFLQIVLNPNRRDGDHTCYITRHWSTATVPADIPCVTDARGSGPFTQVMQSLCSPVITPELAAVRDGLRTAALTLLTLSPLGAAATEPLLRAAESFDRINSEHLFGDAVADALNIATENNLADLAEMVVGAMLDTEQRPWKVWGTRFEIADFFDYENDCYRGDSVELFFEVNDDLPRKINEILDTFSEMRERGLAVGAYVSLRFMAGTKALLGMARWNPTCSVEVAMLRGLLGNSDLLTLLQEVTLRNGGLVHWGQQHDLDRAQVESDYGPSLTRWREKLEMVEGFSPLFSNPFTQARGLEVIGSVDWSGWTGLDHFGSSSPGVVSAWGDQPLEIFSQNRERMIYSCQRPGSGGTGRGWVEVRGDQVNGRPVVVRGRSGRLELFVQVGERIKHCWQEHRPGGRWSSWDTLGHGGYGRVVTDPAVVAHADGRLELFARGFAPQLYHCWAHWTDGPWANFKPWGAEEIRTTPSACHRSYLGSDQLIVVAATEDGRVVEKHQRGPGGDSDWTDWAIINPHSIRRSSGTGGPVVINIIGLDREVHLLINDNGQIFEVTERGAALSLDWTHWRRLPEAANEIDPGGRLTWVQTDRLYLFGRSRTPQPEVLVCEFQPGGTWSDWYSLGGEIAGDVAAGAHADGTIEVVVRNGATNQLMSRRQVRPGVW